MKHSVIACLVIITILIVCLVMTEADRNYSFYRSPKEYYTILAKFPPLGVYNTFIRLSNIHNKDIYNQAFIPMKYFKCAPMFRNAFTMIRDEALKVNTNDLKSFHEIDKEQSEISNDSWKVFVLKWYDGISDRVKQLCPITTSLIEQCPDVKSAMFSILKPGMHIIPHRGPFTGCLRYHLALKVPKDTTGCFIENNGIRYHWKEGEDVLFDDTFTHQVYNRTDETRIVLFMDVLRPLPIIPNAINKLLTSSASINEYVKQVNDKNEKSISIA